MQTLSIRSGSVEVTVLLECDAASLGDLVIDVSRQHGGLVFKGPNVRVGWALEQGTTTLSRNVGQ